MHGFEGIGQAFRFLGGTGGSGEHGRRCLKPNWGFSTKVMIVEYCRYSVEHSTNHVQHMSTKKSVLGRMGGSNGDDLGRWTSQAVDAQDP